MDGQLFLVERYWPDVDPSRVRGAADDLVAAAAAAGITCVESFAIAADGAAFLVVSDESEPHLRDRLATAGIAVDRISRAEKADHRGGPGGAMPSAGARDRGRHG